ncbi:UNVERIFIED_CONTAM: hypothetical protein Scaly_1406300 [Sesamum calycinum]|uniref:Uncharacterized protein n=1 Tax=Sesamum calycinum TaxID=2727403 RepID=A0AAW2PRT8_9LAMI
MRDAQADVPWPNGFGRNLRSKTRWFTGFCNSHQTSPPHGRPADGGTARRTLRLVFLGAFRAGGFDNDPSAGSPTETLLRLLLPLNDKVQWTSRDVAGSEPPTSPRSEHFTGPFNRQIAPPTKNGHAPPPIESRKSSQSVNPYYVWTCAGGTTRPVKTRSASPAEGTRRPVHTRGGPAGPTQAIRLPEKRYSPCELVDERPCCEASLGNYITALSFLKLLGLTQVKVSTRELALGAYPPDSMYYTGRNMREDSGRRRRLFGNILGAGLSLTDVSFCEIEFHTRVSKMCGRVTTISACMKSPVFCEFAVRGTETGVSVETRSEWPGSHRTGTQHRQMTPTRERQMVFGPSSQSLTQAHI